MINWPSITFFVRMMYLSDSTHDFCWANLQVLPDAGDAIKLIEQAIEICKAKKKGAHAFWICSATPEGLLGDFKTHLGLGDDFDNVNSVMPKVMATSAPMRSLTCSIR